MNGKKKETVHTEKIGFLHVEFRIAQSYKLLVFVGNCVIIL